MTNVHGDGNGHEPEVEAHEGGVFLQAVVFDQASSDRVEEVPVQAGVDDENDDFGGSVPVLIDRDVSARCLVSSRAGQGWAGLLGDSKINEREREREEGGGMVYAQFADWRVQMGWNPDAEHGYIDTGDNGGHNPLDSDCGLALFHYDGDPIDDDLHEKLNLYGTSQRVHRELLVVDVPRIPKETLGEPRCQYPCRGTTEHTSTITHEQKSTVRYCRRLISIGNLALLQF